MGTAIMMDGGTVLVVEPAVVLSEPFCGFCGVEMFADDNAYVVVAVDRDGEPREVSSGDYGYCSRLHARKGGAL